MAITIRETKLYYQEGNSDKVYNVWIEKQTGSGLYTVLVAYGRRGYHLTQGIHRTASLESNANYYFDNLVESKKKKGYKEESFSAVLGNDQAATPQQLKILKSYVPVVPPGLSKKQAQYMIDEYQKEKTFKEKIAAVKNVKGVQMIPKLIPLKSVFTAKIPSIAIPEMPDILVSISTGRRIKEIDE